MRSGRDEKLGDATERAIELIYCCTPPTAGGLVAPRDFVNMRAWERRPATSKLMPSALVSAGIGVRMRPGEPDTPESAKNVVHGEGGLAGYIVEPAAAGGGCVLTWVLNSDIKGWIPKKIVDNEIANAMLALVRSLRGEVGRQRAAFEAAGKVVIRS